MGRVQHKQYSNAIPYPLPKMTHSRRRGTAALVQEAVMGAEWRVAGLPPKAAAELE